MGTNVEGFRNFEKDFNAGRTFAAFNSAYVIWVNVSLFGKELLTEACFIAELKHCFADDFTLRISHWELRKQKRANVTTHAQCRTIIFALVFHRAGCKTDMRNLRFMENAT